MQRELIEMLEEIIQYVEVWNAHDQSVLDKAEALIEKAKNNAPAVPQGEPDFWGSGDGCWVRATDKLARPDASRFNIPLYAAPSQEPVAEQETLVGLSIHGKELRNENIVYDGGPLDLTDCKLLSCYVEFSKAAARTVQFLAIAEQSQPGFLQPLFADAVRLTKPSQEPVTLTDEEIDRVVLEAVGFEGYGCQAMNKADMRGVSRAIIAALRAKENKL